MKGRGGIFTLVETVDYSGHFGLGFFGNQKQSVLVLFGRKRNLDYNSNLNVLATQYESDTDSSIE